MPSRKELELRGRVLGIDPANYTNDSNLLQRVGYAEYNAATVTGTLASGTVTSDTTANTDGDTVTVGSNVYTFKTALTEAKATATITSTNAGNVSNGDTVLAGGVLYTFRTTIAAANDVNIGTTADNSLTNLVSAITLGGTIGTDYGNGTVVNPLVTATGPSSHVVTVTAKNVGVFSNSLALAAVGATLSTNLSQLAGGVDPIANQVLIGSTSDGSAGLTNLKAALIGVANKGTTFSSNTAPHPLVTPTTLTGSTLLVNATKAASDMTIATTGSTGAAHLSWGATTLTGNVAAVIAKSTYASTGTGGAPV